MKLGLSQIASLAAMNSKPLNEITLDDLRGLNDNLQINLSESTLQALHNTLSDPKNAQTHVLGAIGHFVEDRRRPKLEAVTLTQCPECLHVFNPAG